MIIDITCLNNNSKNKIDIKKDNIELELTDDRINALNSVSFDGCVKRSVDDSISLTGLLKGVMILRDDITLEDTYYDFSTQIEENVQNNQNLLDISKILWENILVEIPSKVRGGNSSQNLPQGNGWRVITEEELEKERQSNNPFKDLDKLIEKER